jgi:serine protease AprX
MISVILFLLAASTVSPIQQQLYQKNTQQPKNIRLITLTSSSQDKADFVSKGCKIVYELNESTVVECPANIVKNIPNAVEDRKFNITNVVLQKGVIPNNINIQDLWDNTYLEVPKLWDKGITGKGRVVAILDTGIDYNHPELSDSYLAGYNFAEYCYSESGENDFNYPDPLGCAFLESKIKCTASTLDCVWKERGSDAMDDNGHGTHVSGIITSNGLVNPMSKGIAPDALIMMGKVCDKWGGCWESDILAGLEWAVKGVEVNTQANCYDKCKTNTYCCKGTEGCSYVNQACTGTYTRTETIKPDVISLSLGGEPFYLFGNCDNELMAKTINKIVRKNNIPVVVAAGNWPWGVSIPGCAGQAIVVGAVGDYPDWYRTIASFSGRGYAMSDHGILAPGTYVFSTMPTYHVFMNDLGYVMNYDSMSGTSIATPDVAGLIALMKQGHPTYTPSAIKNQLFRTATDVKYGFIFPEEGYKSYEQGYGLIDIKAV